MLDKDRLISGWIFRRTSSMVFLSAYFADGRGGLTADSAAAQESHDFNARIVTTAVAETIPKTRGRPWVTEDAVREDVENDVR